MISADSPLVAAVWNQILQVTAVLLIVGVVIRTLCKRRPHLAHILWMLVIIKCLTPPLWSSPTSMFSWLPAHTFTNQSSWPSPTAGREGADNSSVQFGSNDLRPELEAAPGPGYSVLSAMVFLWLSGIVILCAIVAIRWMHCWTAIRRSRTTVDLALASYTVDLARRLGLRRRVRVAVTSSPHGPAAIGILAPTILLPAAALAGKTARELEPILAHELIHIRRGDNIFGLLQTLVQIVWWFHPLLWWANRNASRGIERCCDEEVVASLGCKPATYARCLLDVLELKQSLKAVYLCSGMRSAEVTAQRLEDIMKRANGFHRRTPRWYWGLLALTAALVLPGKEIPYNANRAAAQAPARKEDATPKPADLAPKKFLIQLAVCEGKPTPTLREAREKGKVVVLSRPVMMICENQTALLNTGYERVRLVIELTLGCANGKHIPAKMAFEISSINDQLTDHATLDVQHMKHTTNFPLGERVLIRGGVTKLKKEIWIEATVTEVTSDAQALQKLEKDHRSEGTNEVPPRSPPRNDFQRPNR